MVGVEGMRMRVFEGDALRRHFQQGAIVDAEQHLVDLRLAKSASEIAALETAIAISEAALQDTVEAVQVGMTERAIFNLLKMRMLAHGAHGFAFEPLVLAAANAADPHGSPGDRPLCPGDALLIDFGASFDGYNAQAVQVGSAGGKLVLDPLQIFSRV